MAGRLTWILSALFLTIASGARGDGGFFARKGIPPIPAQRALITYQDGVERLVIDSTVGSGGKELAWVIPVPAEPTEFRKVSPGLLKTLSVLVEPRLATERWAHFPTPFVFIAAATLAWIVFLIGKRPDFLGFMLSLGALAGVLAIILLHSRGPVESARSAPDSIASGVEVTQQVQVGDYDLAVLRVESAEGFQQWLAGNGFAELPPEGVPIVNDYIREGWRFVAAKLARSEEEGVSSHTVEIAFPAQEPVYPMRLTALAKSDVYLELFVIADKGARAPRLEVEVSSPVLSLDSRWGTDSIVHDAHLSSIRHPEFFSHAWDGCRLTRLCGVVKPSEMTSDIVLEMAPAKDLVLEYYTKAAAVNDGILAGIWLGVPVCVGGALLVSWRLRKQDGRVLMGLVLLLAVGSGTAAGIHSFSQKRIAVAQERHRVVSSDPQGVMEELSEHYVDFANAGLVENPADLAENVFMYTLQVNGITQERLQFEDSPGNILVFPSERGVVLREYDESGGAHDEYYTCAPAKGTATQERPSEVDKYETLFTRDGSSDVRFLLGHRRRRLDPDSVRLLLACKRHAAELRPFVVEKLRKLLPIRDDEEEVAQFYMSALGLMTQTVPPFDFGQEAVEDFIKKASERELP